MQMRTTQVMRHHIFSAVAIGSIALVVSYIVTDQAGTTLFKTWDSPSLAAWVQAVGSIAAILASVWLVQHQHLLEREKAEEQQMSSRADLVNGAMLVLKSQLEVVASLKRQILADVESHPARHVLLPAAQNQFVDHLTFDQKAFAFLLGTPAQEVFMNMLLAHDTFHTAIRIANDRSEFHRTQFQSRLEKSALDLEVGATPAAVETAVGHRVSHTLKRMTDDLYSEIDQAITRLSDVGKQAPPELRKALPGHRVVAFTLPTAVQ
jgi:hypothetical protein